MTTILDKKETVRDKTLEFLKYENEYSALSHAPLTLDAKEAEKVREIFYIIKNIVKFT